MLGPPGAPPLLGLVELSGALHGFEGVCPFRIRVASAEEQAGRLDWSVSVEDGELGGGDGGVCANAVPLASINAVPIIKILPVIRFSPMNGGDLWQTTAAANGAEKP